MSAPTARSVIRELQALGPFDPEVPYPGPIDDTGALERWVVETVAKR
jgi:hypothetical protein